MLTVKFQGTRSSDPEVYTGARLTWTAITEHFVLYDGDDKVIRTIKGHNLEVKAIVNVSDT